MLQSAPRVYIPLLRLAVSYMYSLPLTALFARPLSEVEA